MAWINTKATFPIHAAIFTMTWQELINGKYEEIIDRMRVLDGSPEILHGILKALVQVFRPELDGACIEFMDLRWDLRSVEIGVTHASLPATGLFAEYKRIPLDPNVEKEYAEGGIYHEIAGAK